MDKKEMCKLSGKAKAKARKKAFVEAGKTHGNGRSIVSNYSTKTLKNQRKKEGGGRKKRPPIMVDGKFHGGCGGGRVTYTYLEGRGGEPRIES
jgi:hypothetical protein